MLTQVTLLDEFSDIPERIQIDGITGMAVGIIIILLGVRMVIKIVRDDRENLLQTNIEE